MLLPKKSLSVIAKMVAVKKTTAACLMQTASAKILFFVQLVLGQVHAKCQAFFLQKLFDFDE